MRTVLLHALSADGCHMVFERNVPDPANVLSDLRQFHVVSETAQRILLDSREPLDADAVGLTSRFKGWRLLSNM